MKALMLGGDFWHSPGQYYHLLKNHICEKVDFVWDVPKFRNIDLNTYDILYITKSFYDADLSGNLNQKSILESDEERIKQFIESGNALFLLHAGVTIRAENKILIDVVKGMFIKHPPICKFRIEFEKDLIHQNSHETEDELYHVTTSRNNTNVFAWAVSEEHGRHIVGWRHMHKKGKVAVFTLGHTSTVIASEIYRNTIRNISEWLVNKEH